MHVWEFSFAFPGFLGIRAVALGSSADPHTTPLTAASISDGAILAETSTHGTQTVA